MVSYHWVVFNPSLPNNFLQPRHPTMMEVNDTTSKVKNLRFSTTSKKENCKYSPHKNGNTIPRSSPTYPEVKVLIIKDMIKTNLIWTQTLVMLLDLAIHQIG